MTSPQRPPDGSFARPAAPWKHATGLDAVLARWRADGSIGRNVVLDRTLPARASKTAPFPAALHPDVEEALKARGLTELWSHQADAFLRATGGEDIVVATPTASGKSLCYNLPVLDRLAREPDARALYHLSDEGALTRPGRGPAQAPRGGRSSRTARSPTTATRPGDARRVARERSGLILTNPDMLHAGILPHHASVGALLREPPLRHHRRAAHVPRRLRLAPRERDPAARSHRAFPRRVADRTCSPRPPSATPRATRRGCRVDVALVGESGAPRREKNVVVYNPPIVNARAGPSRELRQDAVRLVGRLWCARACRRLVFGQSRNQVETMLKYLRDRLAPGPRRPFRRSTRIEVVICPRPGAASSRACGPARSAASSRRTRSSSGSTSARSMRSCAPATPARSPRSGSGSGVQDGGRASSLALLVASSMPLDQYVALEPRASCRARVRSSRRASTRTTSRSSCSTSSARAFELPFEAGESFGDVPQVPLADALGLPRRARSGAGGQPNGGKRAWHWATDAYPGERTSRCAACRGTTSSSSTSGRPRRPSRRWTGARRTRCCTSRRSTSTRASSSRSSVSTSRTTRRSCARSRPTTSPPR
jgi:DEAD/DEAH box helicase domain-containing protein